MVTGQKGAGGQSVNFDAFEEVNTDLV